ncbi:hypothetical protein ACSQ67_016229 [Phaseolus vulgaris]
MTMGDLMASRFYQNHHDDSTVSSCTSSSSVAVVIASYNTDGSDFTPRCDSETAIASSSGNYTGNGATSMAYLPQIVVLCELRHEAFEAAIPAASDNSLVSKWRPKDRVSLLTLFVLSAFCCDESVICVTERLEYFESCVSFVLRDGNLGNVEKWAFWSK